jgi:hypothetical protein
LAEAIYRTGVARDALGLADVNWPTLKKSTGHE